MSMALTNAEAQAVVIDCVELVTGRRPLPFDSLEDGGLDDVRLPAFVDRVTVDAKHGVKRFGYDIDPGTLGGLAVEDTVQDTADVVRRNATQQVAPKRKKKRKKRRDTR